MTTTLTTEVDLDRGLASLIESATVAQQDDEARRATLTEALEALEQLARS